MVGRPAPVWKRAMAFVIDMLVLEFFVFSHFDTLLQNLTPYTLSSGQFASFTMLTTLLGSIVLLYFTLLEFLFGQSLGQMATHLFVTPASLWRIALSNIVFIPVFPFIILWIIEPLMVIFSQQHQRLLHTLLGMQVIEIYEVNTLWNQLKNG